MLKISICKAGVGSFPEKAHYKMPEFRVHLCPNDRFVLNTEAPWGVPNFLACFLLAPMLTSLTVHTGRAAAPSFVSGSWFAETVLSSGLFSMSESSKKIKQIIFYEWYKEHIRHDINDLIMINAKICIQCFHVFVSCVKTESERDEQTHKHIHTRKQRQSSTC